MPSASLQRWQNDRMLNLTEIDTQCAASPALVPANPRLVDENLRGYVLLLSAHFQGFCRDLYTECAQIIVSKVRPKLQPLIQSQFAAHLRLDHGNPNLKSLKEDFERFGTAFNLATADPANQARLANLSRLNDWRNVAAHQGNLPTGAPLSLLLLQAWRNSCDGLATSLDQITYNVVRRILRRSPWVP
jgi:hypothetical protein